MHMPLSLMSKSSPTQRYASSGISMLSWNAGVVCPILMLILLFTFVRGVSLRSIWWDCATTVLLWRYMLLPLENEPRNYSPSCWTGSFTGPFFYFASSILDRIKKSRWTFRPSSGKWGIAREHLDFRGEVVEHLSNCRGDRGDRCKRSERVCWQ
jgi:hypothetical protein